MIRFENVDVLVALEKIVNRHVEHYRDDFDLDKKLIRRLIQNGNDEDRHLLWMARNAGTWCLREREAYLIGTRAYNTWKFYGEQTRDEILAFSIALSPNMDGNAFGTIHELDYRTSFKRVKELALPVAYTTVHFEDGTICRENSDVHKKLINMYRRRNGKTPPFTRTPHPECEGELSMILRRERFERNYYSLPCTVDFYIKWLPDVNADEKPSVTEKLKPVPQYPLPQQAHKKTTDRGER